MTEEMPDMFKPTLRGIGFTHEDVVCLSRITVELSNEFEVKLDTVDNLFLYLKDATQERGLALAKAINEIPDIFSSTRTAMHKIYEETQYDER